MLEGETNSINRYKFWLTYNFLPQSTLDSLMFDGFYKIRDSAFPPIFRGTRRSMKERRRKRRSQRDGGAERQRMNWGRWKGSSRNFQRVAEDAHTVAFCLAVSSREQWLWRVRREEVGYVFFYRAIWRLLVRSRRVLVLPVNEACMYMCVRADWWNGKILQASGQIWGCDVTPQSRVTWSTKS